MRYFDTRVVFSLYINETRMKPARRSVDIELRKNPADIIISPWVDLELKSALSLGVRSGRLSLQDAQVPSGSRHGWNATIRIYSTSSTSWAIAAGSGANTIS